MAKKQKETTYRKGRNGAILLVLMILLIALSLVLACTVFFRVETVRIEGNARYSEEQILAVANVDMGSNLILTPGDQIAQRLYDGLPYIDRVEVHKHFPTTILLDIVETTPVAVIATELGVKWIIDGKGKLLEPTDDATAAQYIDVQGLQAIDPQVGKTVQVGEGHVAQLSGLLNLLQVLNERGMAGKISSINASSRTELVMLYDGRLQAKLLNNVDFNRKILILEEIAAVLGDSEYGVIDMKSEKVFYSPG